MAGWALVACLALQSAAPAQTSRPTTAPADADVAAAIRRGLDWLYARQKPDGTWDSPYARQYPAGTESLAALAALSAGEDANRPEIAKALGYLKRIDPETVYARAFRAMAYARLGGEEFQRRLGADVAWLLKAQDRAGGWGYGPRHPTTLQDPDWSDASNSQLALLALGEAAAAGASVPESAWTRAQKFWLDAQNADGGWGYEAPRGASMRLRGSSYGSLTAAGAASLLLTLDRLAPPRPARPGEPFVVSDEAPRKALDRALAWLNQNYAVDRVPRWVWGAGEDWLLYYHHQLARLGESAGLGRIAGQDFRSQMAACLLALQRGDGSWSASDDPNAAAAQDAAVRTSLAVLALAKLRAPLVIGRLSLEGPWGGNYRDAANVAAWLTRQWGRPFAWQLLEEAAQRDSPRWGLQADATRQTMAEAPLLYLPIPEKFSISLPLAAEIRAYLAGGGTLVVQSLPEQTELPGQLAEYFRQMLPGATAAPLPADHPVFRARYRVPAVEGVGLSDGLRTRVFVLAGDLSGPAHYSSGSASPAALQCWANLLLYATDMEPPAARSPAPPAPPATRLTVRTIAVGRLRHPEGWNVCPQAMRRLSDVLAAALSLGVDEKPLGLDGPLPKDVPLVWLTGTAGFSLDGSQAARLKEYLQAGGTLFADPAVGQEEFFQAVGKLVREAFGRDLQPLPADDPLLTGRFSGGIGCNVSSVAFTRSARALAGAERGRPPVYGLRLADRWAVIVSRYAVTCPVEGIPTYGLVGVARDDARRLAANVVLYAAWKPRR